MNKKANITRAMPIGVAVAALVLAGCSSNDSKIYDAFKCGKVAMMMGRMADARAASANVEQYFGKIKGNQTQYMMLLSQKFTDDLELHRYGRDVAVKIIAKTYESSTCQALYK